MDIIFKITGHVVNFQHEFGEKYKSLLVETGKSLYGGVPCTIAAKFNSEYRKEIWDRIQSRAIYAGDLVELEVELTGQKSKDKVYNNLELRSVTVLQKAGGQVAQPAQQMQPATMQQPPMCPPFGTPESLHFEHTLGQWVVWNQQARVWGFLNQSTGQWLALQPNTLADFVPAQQHQMSQQMGQGGGIPQGYVAPSNDMPY